MLSRRIIKAIEWLLFAVVVATPLFYFKWSLFPYTVPKTAIFEILVELVFALWLVLAISDLRYRPQMTPLAWAVVAYLGLLTVTAFTGVDPWRSFFSDLERAFGILMYYHLAALALVVSSLRREMPWKKLWYFSFGTSLVTAGIALIQLKVPDLLLAADSGGGRPGSTFGNPTFLAGYLLFNIFLAAYYLFEKNSVATAGEKIFLWATVLIGIVAVFITETRGDILGLFAGIFVLVLLFAFRPPDVSARHFSRRSFYVLLLVILVILAGGIWFTRDNSIWDRVPGIDRLKSLTFSGANSDIEPRIMATSAAWQGFLERPLTGWGYENFNVVFNKFYNPQVLEYGYTESNFDKPHDILLEQLDAGGALLLIAYLALLVAAVYEAWKLKDRLFGQLVAAALAAYLVRSIVIFDTIGPAMMLWFLFAWVDGKYAATRTVAAQEARNRDARRSATVNVNRSILAVMLIPTIIFAYMMNGTALAASYVVWEGHENLQFLNLPSAGLADLRTAAAMWNVYQWDFDRDYANTVAQAYFYNESAIPQDDVKLGIAAMNQVAVDHPNDAYNHYLLTDIYNLAYDIDPQEYGPQAEAQAQIALQLSPDRQEIYFYLEKTKSLEGDTAGAIALAKQALALDPKVADAHFYYGMLAFSNGDVATGYSEVEAAIAMGRTWVNYHEPEVAADYFADSGHLTDAIGLYEIAFSMEPTDYSAEAKLGVAYFENHDAVSAKRYLSDAAAHIDFSASPAFSQFRPILDELGIQ